MPHHLHNTLELMCSCAQKQGKGIHIKVKPNALRIRFTIGKNGLSLVLLLDARAPEHMSTRGLECY